MENDTDQIFEDYLAAHADDVKIDFAPLLEKHPLLKIELERNIIGYRKIMGILSDDAPVATSSMVGEEISGCRIVKMLGQGGMGIAYLARQEKLGRDVVIKILRPFAVDNPTLKERFERESRVIAKLDHKGIVPVYDVGEQNGSLYILMKHVVGMPLNRLIDRLSGLDRSNLKMTDIVKVFQDLFPEKLAPDLVSRHKSITEFFCHLVIQIAEALQYAHDNGIIHRDVKPSNIILEPDGNPVILDFGLSHDELEVNLTVSGEFLGTPVYSAPESFGKSGFLDLKKLDIYSLGVTMYELLTGKLPYEGTSIYEIYNNVRHKDPIAPRAGWNHIPKDLDTIILTAIAKEKAFRYKTVGEFCADIRCFLDYLPIQAKAPTSIQRIVYFAKRKRWELIGLSFVSLLLVVGGYFYFQNKMQSKRLTELEIGEQLKGVSDAIRYRGDYEGALVQVKKVYETHPDNPMTYIWYYALKLKTDGNFSGFVSAVSEIEKRNPDNLHVLLGKLYIKFMEKKLDEVKTIKKRLFQDLNDNKKWAAILLYMNYLGVPKDLLSDLSSLAIEKYPNDPDINFLMSALCTEETGDSGCKIPYIEKAAQFSGSYLLVLSDDYVKDTSIKILEKINFMEALRKKSLYDLSPEYFKNLSILYYRAGDCKKFGETIDVAIQLDPKNKDFHEIKDETLSKCEI